MRVSLVSAPVAAIGEVDADLPLLQAALHRIGADSAVSFWSDESVDWESFDLVVIKSPWDYSERADEFLGWLSAVGASTRVANCPHLIRWNLDKRYLADLATAGVQVVPTRYADTIAEVGTAVEALTSGQLVIKPTVSAGSRNTGLFDVGDPGALSLAERILNQGKTVMVQPAIESVASSGEHALILFDGTYSHAINKGPLLSVGGGLVGGSYKERVRSIEPDQQEIALAHDCFAAAQAAVARAGCDCTDSMPLYGRFDIVQAPDGFAILEAEMFEPSYFIASSPSSADRFAAAVEHRLAT